jgi:hypothetical protein
MNFEHLIQINDPENPLIDPLHRDQLWQGLLYRVENPVPFLPGLESCTILERQCRHPAPRTQFRPGTIIRDRVTLALTSTACASTSSLRRAIRGAA